MCDGSDMMDHRRDCGSGCRFLQELDVDLTWYIETTGSLIEL